jgi:redox-sensitive bicupin YhaK (pirin superfamily)
VEVIITAREESIGTFSVRRSLPSVKRRMVGPFTFLDHMGPATTALSVLPHPHIGIATLTYLFVGDIVHRDTLGNTQAIRPREVNWMISGRGIAHSERASSDAARMHGIQAWIALPVEFEEMEPGFTHLDADQLSAVGENARLLSGSAYGVTSPAPSLSPHFYVAVHLRAGERIALPREHRERAVYVATGAVEMGAERCGEGQLMVASPGGEPVLTALEESDVMLLGGEPVGHRFMWWNFVSSRKERIEAAKEDWRQGRIRLPPDDDREFVPLPPDLRPKPEPMS